MAYLPLTQHQEVVEHIHTLSWNFAKCTATKWKQSLILQRGLTMLFHCGLIISYDIFVNIGSGNSFVAIITWIKAD